MAQTPTTARKNTPTAIPIFASVRIAIAPSEELGSNRLSNRTILLHCRQSIAK
jgi:hypothetical protein